MSWAGYGFLIIFGLFVLLLFINPNLSCFGKRLRSPFYPLRRKKNLKRQAKNYGFHLVDDKQERLKTKVESQKTKDYGFRLN